MRLELGVPLAVALGVLAALPILAHLTLQSPRNRRAFGAMLLVERMVKRLRRQRRITDPLLLVLRLLGLIGLLGAAMAPTLVFPEAQSTVEGTGRVIFVLDRSMSMGQRISGGSLLDRGKGSIRQRIGEMPQGVQMALFTYDDQVVALTDGFTTDRELVLARLQEVETSLSGSKLAPALLEARRLMDGDPSDVVVVTDEAGPTMVPDASEELSRLVSQGAGVIPVSLAPDDPQNVTVEDVRYAEGVEGGILRFSVLNFGEASREVRCEVALPDSDVIDVFVDLTPGQRAEKQVTLPREAMGGVGSVYCEDEALPLDDRFFFHLPQTGGQRVLVVDGDPGDTPTQSEVYFLERALAPWGEQSSGLTPDVVGPAGVTSLDSDEYQVVFLANVADPRPFASELKTFVSEGGAVVISMGNNITPGRYNEAFGVTLPAKLRKVRDLADRNSEEPVRLRIPAVGGGLFSTFSASGMRALQEIGAWKVMTTEPYQDSEFVRTLLTYEGDHPALIERRVGQGKVMLWTSSIDYQWSNLPLQAMFTPLMHRLVGYLGASSGSSAQRVDALVGETVSIGLGRDVASAEVRGPSGERISSFLEGQTVRFRAEVPGAFVVVGPGDVPLAYVAVNLDHRESDVRTGPSLQEVGAEVDPDKFERREELAPPLLGAAGIAWLLAGLWASRRRTT